MEDGLLISVPGGSFKRTLGPVTYPVLDGLACLHYYGTSVEKTERSMAPDGTDGEAVGLIDVSNPYWMVNTGTTGKYLQHAFSDAANDITVIGVFRNIAQTVRMFGNAANVEGSTPRNGELSLYLNSDGKPAFVVSNASADARAVVDGIGIGTFTFWAGRVSGTSVSLSIGQAGGLVQAFAGSPFTRTRSATPLKSGVTPGGPNNSDQLWHTAATSVHSVAVSDANLLRIYKWFRKYYAARGITVA